MPPPMSGVLTAIALLAAGCAPLTDDQPGDPSAAPTSGSVTTPTAQNTPSPIGRRW